MVVDDAANTRRFFTQLLEEEGHEVVSAANGEEAVRRFRESPCQIVFMDILMPEKDGLAATREILGMDPEVRIVAMTGGGEYLNQDVLTWAKVLGAVHTLMKPVQVQDILDTLELLL